MIDQILQFLCEDLNSYLKRKQAIENSIVELSPLMNLDGSVAANESKIIATVVSIERDRSLKNLSPIQQRPVQMPLQLHLNVLFAAHFSAGNYNDGLAFLSEILTYFESHDSFFPENFPGLPKMVETMRVEIINLEIQELNKLWAALGANQLPSLLYRIRVLVQAEDSLTPTISKI